MNIIAHKSIFLFISGLLVLASILAIAVWGLKPGLDFVGGSLLEVEFIGKRPDVETVKRVLEPLGFGAVLIQPTGERGLILRFKDVDEETHQQLLLRLSELEFREGQVNKESGVTEKRFDTIGPTIGRELKQNALVALALAVAAIVLYIAWAFRKVSRPVSSWKYGVAAVAALIHDILIPSGVFAALGNFRGVEVDTLFVTALLTIMGFSVHDTIVVFDRIRENLYGLKIVEPFEVTVNRSINQTLTRSLNTSLTVLLVLGAIFFLGGESTKYFSSALIIGIIFGTYSSIFVASPLLVIWNQLSSRKK